MSKSFMILCLIVVVIFAPMTATNAYAEDSGVIWAGLLIGATVFGLIQMSRDDYLPDREQDPAVQKHLDRLNAVQFTGPESQGRAEQQGNAGTNAGVTYTLFEW